jgi:esterase/lipase superfamily enzyme
MFLTTPIFFSLFSLTVVSLDHLPVRRLAGLDDLALLREELELVLLAAPVVDAHLEIFERDDPSLKRVKVKAKVKVKVKAGASACFRLVFSGAKERKKKKEEERRLLRALRPPWS